MQQTPTATGHVPRRVVHVMTAPARGNCLAVPAMYHLAMEMFTVLMAQVAQVQHERHYAGKRMLTTWRLSLLPSFP